MPLCPKLRRDGKLLPLSKYPGLRLDCEMPFRLQSSSNFGGLSQLVHCYVKRHCMGKLPSTDFAQIMSKFLRSKATEKLN